MGRNKGAREMNIDFIKWLCEKADGFKVSKDRVVCLGWESNHNTVIEGCEYWNGVYYPLLLQRAIEKIREIIPEYHELKIDYVVSYGWSFRYGSITSQDFFNNPDQAKESALKYIWEQEK